MSQKDKLAEEFLKFHVAISQRNLNLLETVRKDAINQLESVQSDEKQRKTETDFEAHENCQD